MSPRALRALLLGWTLATLGAALAAYEATAPATSPPPPEDATDWALDALEATRLGLPVPPPPASARSYRAPAPIVVLAFAEGRPVVRSEGARTLEVAVRVAIAELERRRAELPIGRFWSVVDGRARFSLGLPLGDGFAPVRVPGLRSFAYVPTRDALVATIDGRSATLTPDEMVPLGLLRGAIGTGLPELDVGVPIDAALAALALRLDVTPERLLREGRFVHRRMLVRSRDVYPRAVPPSEEAARRGVLLAADYLVRHQEPGGAFVYEVDRGTGAQIPGRYLFARHAGAAYFLAQAARLGHPAAGDASAAAIDWLLRFARPCGAPDRLCLDEGGWIDGGTAALTLLAIAELERSAPDPRRRATLRGFAEFLLGLQRPDGEFMHRFDPVADRPLDVQLPYFSGEMALGLLRAEAVTGDARYLCGAERSLRYLAARSWSFPASRYVHAEEHWTCIAAGEARGRVDTDAIARFCASVYAWNEWTQLEEGDSPFDVAGNYGLGPLFAPRFAALGTRLESFVELSRLLASRHEEPPGMRAHLRRGVAAILAHQLDPGPTRHLADVDGVRGGFSGSVTDPIIRIDHVQHLGSALARYVDLLADERLARSARRSSRPPDGRPDVR